MKRRRPLVVIVAAVAVVAAVSITASAPAAWGFQSGTVPTEFVHDAAGDVPNPHGDILIAGAGTDDAGYAFSVYVKAPVDPRIDGNWTRRTTQIDWFLDTNLDGTPDAVAVFDADSAGNLHAVMERYSDQFVYCTGAGRYTAAHTYLAIFPAGCIPGLKRFRWSVIMVYDTGATQNDLAPDLSFAPVLTLGKVGYWMLGADARVYNFGSSFPARRAAATAVAITSKRDGSGYWIVDAKGRVFTAGTAQQFGGAPSLGIQEVVTTISATPTGAGYWLFTNRGRVVAYGDARPHGSLESVHLNGPIVASAATPTGFGYYMVGSDGGVFAFGDAKFHGSMGGRRLNQPVIGIAPTPDNAGYWLVASDGGVFDFSNRKFLGSLAGRKLPAPIVGIAAFTT